MFNQLSLKSALLASLLVLAGINPPVFAASKKIRVGHFPNVTHAPVLIARAQHHFETRLGEGVKIDWKIFNAGPEAIEALFAGGLDILYVGPNPAINGFVRSKGEALRVIAGASSGGSGFVVRSGSGIEKFEDIKGKRVASPQKGNSQDVALHHLMKEKGLAPRSQGGDVEVFNISGGDQITAFLKNQVDGIWTVEPWLTRLVTEANGKILFEESELWPEGKYATTLLVARKRFLDEQPDLVHRWLKAHIEIIDWINQNYTQAKPLFNKEFQREGNRPLPPAYLDRFFSRIEFTADPLPEQVLESARRAGDIGYLGREKIDLSNLYDLSLLDAVKGEEEKKG